MQLGATEASTKITKKSTKGIGQREMKGATEDCFLFDGCFSSYKSAESAMGFGADMIVMVKTNTKGFCKETIENLTKHCPGDSYLMLSIDGNCLFFITTKMVIYPYPFLVVIILFFSLVIFIIDCISI